MEGMWEIACNVSDQKVWSHGARSKVVLSAPAGRPAASVLVVGVVVVVVVIIIIRAVRILLT
jgi:hypothetical protein